MTSHARVRTCAPEYTSVTGSPSPWTLAWQPDGVDESRLRPPRRREATIWWPEEQLDALTTVLAQQPGRYEVTPGGADAPATARTAVVAYHDHVHAGLAAAYALSTGAEAALLPRGTPVDGAVDTAVVIGDLLATSVCDLEAAGCVLAPGVRRRHPVGFLHVDAALAGITHVVKNLLARLELLPTYQRRLFLAPSLGTSQALQLGDETMLLGDLEAGQFREHLSAPHGQLFALAHSEPFDMLFGSSVLCALADRPRRDAPGATPGAGDERAFACFDGAGCIAAFKRPWIDQWLPASSFAATHATWLGCSAILHGDSPYRSHRALIFQLLAAPPTVSVLSSVQWTNDSPQELLHASFLLRECATLQEYVDRLDTFTRGFRGSDPQGRLLLGDPSVRVSPCADDAPGAPALVAEWDATGRLELRPRAVRERFAVPAGVGAGRVYAKDTRGLSMIGSMMPALSGEGAVCELLSLDGEGIAPAALTLRASVPVAETLARLQRWHQRTAFWRSWLLTVRASLRQAPEQFAEPLALCERSLDDVIGLEDVIARAARVATPGASLAVSAWDAAIEERVAFVERAITELQPRLMTLATQFAGQIGAHLQALWVSGFVPPAQSRPSRCACGVRGIAETWRAPFGGMRRVLLRCSRCDLTADHEYGVRRVGLELAADRVAVSDPIVGVLRGIRQRGTVPVVVGAALATEPRADGMLTLTGSRLLARPGSVELRWTMRPERAQGMQQLYLFVVNDLEWHMLRAWLLVERR